MDYKEPILVIDSKVLKSSFQEFINCCQGRSYTLSLDNMCDLRYLSKEWNVKSLKRDYRTMKARVSVEDLALSRLLRAERIEKKGQVRRLIPIVAEHLEKIIESGRALQLSVSLLGRIMTHPELRCPGPVLCKFLRSKCAIDDRALNLFQLVDESMLTEYDSLWIKQRQSKDALLTLEQVTLGLDIEKYLDRMDEIQKALDALEKDDRISRLSQELQSLTEEVYPLINRLDDVGSDLASTQKRLKTN